MRAAPCAKQTEPQHSGQRKWVKFGVHRQAFASESQFGFEIRQGLGKMTASEEATGKCRLDRFPWGLFTFAGIGRVVHPIVLGSVTLRR